MWRKHLGCVRLIGRSLVVVSLSQLGQNVRGRVGSEFATVRLPFMGSNSSSCSVHAARMRRPSGKRSARHIQMLVALPRSSKRCPTGEKKHEKTWFQDVSRCFNQHFEHIEHIEHHLAVWPTVITTAFMATPWPGEGSLPGCPEWSWHCKRWDWTQEIHKRMEH